MIYAVTAVSGQLGYAIASKLIDKVGTKHVIGLARTPANVRDLGIEVRPGDYDRRDQLEVALVGVDALVLVSGMAPPDERIGQHRSVIAAAKAAGVKKIVYTSIQGPEDGTPFSPIVQSNAKPKMTFVNAG